MDLDKYIKMPNCKIENEVIKKMNLANSITKTPFEDKNSVILDKNLQFECGYALMDTNYYLVSMYTQMPNVTVEMVNWWFWWHPQESKRYKAWYPKEHIAINYDKKDKAYFSQQTPPKFEPNTQFPIERVGGLVVPLSIKFVSPEDFGFDKKIMVENEVEIIICGHVSAFKGLFPNTEMAHIFLKFDKGLFLVSRFWLGKNVENKFLKKFFVTKKQAEGMAYHCCIEYRNFANRIPEMYKEWLNEINKI